MFLQMSLESIENKRREVSKNNNQLFLQMSLESVENKTLQVSKEKHETK
jgi:hypothetical protein